MSSAAPGNSIPDKTLKGDSYVSGLDFSIVFFIPYIEAKHKVQDLKMINTSLHCQPCVKKTHLTTVCEITEKRKMAAEEQIKDTKRDMEKVAFRAVRGLTCRILTDMNLSLTAGLIRLILLHSSNHYQ